MTRCLAILFVVFGLTTTADAEPWYRGKYGKNRVIHLTLTVGAGAGWLTAELLRDTLVPTQCRWCDPPGFDRAARNAVVWNNRDRADKLSNYNAYLVSPIVGLGLLIASDHDASAARLVDDLLPIVETVAFAQLFIQVAKLSFLRQRPYAHFDTTGAAFNSDDHLSFPSGHSSLGFALTTSAGLVAHWRGYWTEPYIWSIGITLSLTTEYLRMAADKHYLSDVFTGGLIGVGAGLLVPRLMRRDLKLVPIKDGAALVGQF